MKKYYLLIAVLCIMNIAYSQNYVINFAGTGSISTVGSVEVKNLTQNTTLTLNGTDVLQLGNVSINELDRTNENIKVYPNPIQGQSAISFYAKQTGNADIIIFDVTGKRLMQTNRIFSKGIQNYRLTGLKQGIYIIKIKGENYYYSEKLISLNTSEIVVKLEYIGSNRPENNINTLKGTNTTVNMAYNIGDRLLFKGISGIFKTIVTDIPVSDKTITFNFVPCTDADNNNYAVVQINTQQWMAENLKTTKYSDGINIPNVADNTTWLGLTTGARCYYNNDSVTYNATYGALYNWYSATSTHNACPSGWHLPSNSEWNTLINYLGGRNIAGNKLKETGIVHWQSPNSASTNESGFTALPAGDRVSQAAYYDLGTYGFWWSSNEFNTQNAYTQYIYYNSSNVDSLNFGKAVGFSIRCIKN